MTLIAAFNIKGFTFLLSDVLLSGGRKPESDPLIPSSLLHEAVPSSGLDYATDLVQKAVILDDMCVIAWSGREIEARAVMSELRDIAANTGLTVENLNHYFDNYDYAGLSGATSFVGWIYEDNCVHPISFQAETKNYGRFGDIISSGSGVPLLDNLIKHHESLYEKEMYRKSHEKVSVVGKKADDPAYFAMSLMADLLLMESMDQVPLSQGFGGLYQIIYLEDGKFIPVESYTFFIVKMRFDIDGSGFEHRPVLLSKYDLDENLLVVHTIGAPENKGYKGNRIVIPHFLKHKGSYDAAEVHRIKTAPRAINSDWQIICAEVQRKGGDRWHFFCDVMHRTDHEQHNVYFRDFMALEYDVQGVYANQLFHSF